jgi:hypothetical protein
MRAFLAALSVCFVFLLAAPAPASAAPRHNGYRHAHHLRHHRHSVRAIRHRHWFAGGALSGPCRIAQSLGGPCGCFASELLFGHSVSGLWPVSSWLRFPRTTPHRGAAAIWPGRHVAVVIAANGDGTVIVHDSWATHRVSIRGLIFVEPNARVGI